MWEDEAGNVSTHSEIGKTRDKFDAFCPLGFSNESRLLQPEEAASSCGRLAPESPPPDRKGCRAQSLTGATSIHGRFETVTFVGCDPPPCARIIGPKMRAAADQTIGACYLNHQPTGPRRDEHCLPDRARSGADDGERRL